MPLARVAPQDQSCTKIPEKSIKLSSKTPAQGLVKEDNNKDDEAKEV